LSSFFKINREVDVHQNLGKWCGRIWGRRRWMRYEFIPFHLRLLLHLYFLFRFGFELVFPSVK